MSGGRTWCPSLDAAPPGLLDSVITPTSVGTTDSPHRRGNTAPFVAGSPTKFSYVDRLHNIVTPMRQADGRGGDTMNKAMSPSKSKGDAAASTSVAATVDGIVVTRAKVVENRNFSARVARSDNAMRRAGAALKAPAGGSVDAASASVGLTPQHAFSHNEGAAKTVLSAPLPAVYLDARSATQLRDILEQLPAVEPGHDASKVALRLNETNAASDEVAAILALPAFEHHAAEAVITSSFFGTLGVAKAVDVLAARDKAARDAKTRTTLRALDLSRNSAALSGAAGGSGAEVAVTKLSKWIEESTSLESLKLSGNALGPTGIAAVAQALLANGSIVALDLTDNAAADGGDAAAAEKIAQLLRENKFLLQVDVGHNLFSAAHVASFFEALSSSDTRVATPPVEPDPEVEEFRDELPPEEEAPPVPPSELPKPEAEAPPAAAGDDGDAAAAETAAAKPKKATAPADGEEGEDGDGAAGDEEAEDDAEEEAPKKKSAVPAAAAVEPEPEPEAEPEDPEEAERLREEREEAERQRKAAEEEAWREQMNTVVWAPQRLRAEYEEGAARRATVLTEYMNESLALKAEEKAAKAAAKGAQARREKEDRIRRSGWTHLRALSVAGNKLNIAASKALALALRHEIPIGTSHGGAADEDGDGAAAGGDRGDDLAEEDGDGNTQQEPVAAAPPVDEEAADREVAEGDPEDPDREEGDGEEGQEAPVAAAPPAQEPTETDGTNVAAAAPAAAAVPKPPKPTKKPGVQTLEFLDLSDTALTSRCLELISPVLASNCPTLKTLLLRKNTFASKKKTIRVPRASVPGASDAADADAAGDDDDGLIGIKVPDESFESAGVAALAKSLSTNTTLTALDLAYNGAYGTSLAPLIHSFHTQSALEVLCLDGNPIGVANPHNFFERFLWGVNAARSLSTLGLANCNLGQWFNETDEATCVSAWTNVPASLTALDLSFNGLTGRALAALSKALGVETSGLVVTLRALNLEGNPALFSGGSTAAGDHDDGTTASGSGPAHDAQQFFAGHGMTLQHLNLNETRLTDAALAVLLRGNTSARFKTLRLRGNLLCQPDALLLALTKMHMLQTLDLGDNDHLATAFAQNVVSAAAELPSVTTISLWSRSNDELPSVLLPAAIDAASKSPALRFVDLGLPAATGVNPEDVPDAVVAVNGNAPVIEELEAALSKNRVAMAIGA